MAPTKSSPCERIKLRCVQCHARICDRLETQDGWTLHYKKGRTSIYTSWMVLTCSECNTTHRITCDKGVVESVRNQYYDPRIQSETSDTPDGGQ